ncbi:MAG: hypothetical protein E8A46_17430 [Bradyrhizobium sp.]|jgi:hypothetical protein|uniref:hypothetical protein n=1 Tax=Bradyrhizobium sp. TaxID=376 RepID=UPI00121DF2C7|nr:hypothetical protein [Bradyrhizobium sp.]THD50604.1 MAG: hypothetical protein E8A46_17430 [Bradyrhizobium sp.]
MSFSLSTFTVEINGTPTIAFQARWHVEADDICRGWPNLHWDEISSKGPRSGVALPPIIKVRLARASEKAAYNVAGNDVEFYGEVKIVKLIDASGRQDETDASVSTENVSDDAIAEQQDAHIGDG